ncbi:hypothetical protein D3C72_1718370 [compost metagenome]
MVRCRSISFLANSIAGKVCDKARRLLKRRNKHPSPRLQMTSWAGLCPCLSNPPRKVMRKAGWFRSRVVVTSIVGIRSMTTALHIPSARKRSPKPARLMRSAPRNNKPSSKPTRKRRLTILPYKTFGVRLRTSLAPWVLSWAMWLPSSRVQLQRVLIRSLACRALWV